MASLLYKNTVKIQVAGLVDCYNGTPFLAIFTANTPVGGCVCELVLPLKHFGADFTHAQNVCIPNPLWGSNPLPWDCESSAQPLSMARDVVRILGVVLTQIENGEMNMSCQPNAHQQLGKSSDSPMAHSGVFVDLYIMIYLGIFVLNQFWQLFIHRNFDTMSS